ncbi:MAG: hypothetical protein J7639_06880 [Paenibacillaceae bacterium]|nr:hypothetical protein [Paenibacillaceae bacterium]
MSQAIELGSRWELLLDRHVIERTDNARLRLHPPVRQEISLRMDRLWEDRGSGVYGTVLKDGGKFRMYYRGASEMKTDYDETQYCCYAESDDGIHWVKPNLGIVSFRGSSDNNIVYAGRFCSNFSPFLDTNPACLPEQRYKAIAGNWKEGLVGFVSADGLHWRRLREEPLITDGAFDSHNVVFWDDRRGRYVCYSRYFQRPTPDAPQYTGVRCIQSCESPDFLNWGPQQPNRYGEEAPLEHFYTNATVPCPGAEHVWLSFPMRFMPERHNIAGFPKVGVSDNVLLSSRDGVNWEREFLEAWLRPGRDPRNWTERSHIVARGILETGAEAEELSLYVCEHYEWDDAHIRRVSVPRHRFASVGAGRDGGEFVTKPLVFAGSRLLLNYATSAPGTLTVQVEREDGAAVPGFAFADAEELYGDELEHAFVWRGGDLAQLAGAPVRLRFRLTDADLFAFRFAE